MPPRTNVDIATVLEALVHPSAEALPDGERLTLFVNAGYDAMIEIRELRAQLLELKATLQHV